MNKEGVIDFNGYVVCRFASHLYRYSSSFFSHRVTYIKWCSVERRGTLVRT